MANQRMVLVQVYQGEERNALGNILIGTYKFELTPNQPAQSPMVLKYELDLNGILKITAIEKNTGKQITGVIENAFSLLSEDSVVLSKSKIDGVWEAQESPVDVLDNDSLDNDTAIGASGIPEAFETVIASARAVLNDAASEDREEIINLIEDIKTQVADGNLDGAGESVEALEDILFYLE